MKVAIMISDQPNRKHYVKTLGTPQSLYLAYSYKVAKRRLPWEDKMTP